MSSGSQRHAHEAAGGGAQPPLREVLASVVQVLVQQGWELSEIARAMREVADSTDLLDKVEGVRN